MISYSKLAEEKRLPHFFCSRFSKVNKFFIRQCLALGISPYQQTKLKAKHCRIKTSLIQGGFNTAVDGLAAFPMILSNLYFKDACQNFAKLGEEIQKEFGFSVFEDEWQKRTNFDEWYNSQNQEKVQN